MLRAECNRQGEVTELMDAMRLPSFDEVPRYLLPWHGLFSPFCITTTQIVWIVSSIYVETFSQITAHCVAHGPLAQTLELMGQFLDFRFFIRLCDSATGLRGQASLGDRGR